MLIETIAQALHVLFLLVLAFAYILTFTLGMLKFSLLALSILCVFGVWGLVGRSVRNVGRHSQPQAHEARNVEPFELAEEITYD